jgi:hypothetical protein
MPARVEAATQLGQREQALVVVWVEGPVQLSDGTQEAVLYVVGQHEGRALLEVVRVPGGRGPDLDRTLALKVRELVDELLRDRAQTASQGASTSGPGPGMLDSPHEHTQSSGEALRWGPELALGALARTQSGAAFGQWGIAAGAGPVLHSGSLRLAALAELSFLPAVTAERAASSVGFWELVPAIGLRGQLREGRIWLGARTGLALAVVHATGHTPSGASRDATERVAAWLLGLDLELPIAAGVGALLGVELWTKLSHQHFAVNHQEVVDLGRVQPAARFGVCWVPR